MKKAFLVLFLCLFLAGCGKNTEEITEKPEEIEDEFLNQQEEKEEINILFSEEYELDGEKISYSVQEDGDDYKVIVLANAKTEEKASLLLTMLSSDMNKINYSICVKYNDLFMVVNSEGVVSGYNKDGSIAFGAPDWYGFPDEDELTEEHKGYIKEIREIENQFLEGVKDLL